MSKSGIVEQVSTAEPVRYACKLLPGNWTVSYGIWVGMESASDRIATLMKDAGIDTGTIRCVPVQTVGHYMIGLQKGDPATELAFGRRR